LPSVVRGAPTKSGSHRALDDIRESIVELRYYRDHLFIAAAGAPAPADPAS
jgi:oligoribonuclease